MVLRMKSLFVALATSLRTFMSNRVGFRCTLLLSYWLIPISFQYCGERRPSCRPTLGVFARESYPEASFARSMAPGFSARVRDGSAGNCWREGLSKEGGPVWLPKGWVFGVFQGWEGRW